MRYYQESPNKATATTSTKIHSYGSFKMKSRPKAIKKVRLSSQLQAEVQKVRELQDQQTQVLAAITEFQNKLKS
jgi:hypothetical protein